METISIIRDWAALALTILCYNEMGWLAPARHTYEVEKGWIDWDRRFLKDWHMKAAIESCGSVFPIILELSLRAPRSIKPVDHFSSQLLDLLSPSGSSFRQ